MSDSKRRFGGRVDDYVAARPTYPAAVVDALREHIGLAADWHVIDVGAGTGISSALFIDAGLRVTGVEPNAAMRDAAAKRFDGDANFTIVDGSAEHTTLPSGHGDLIVAAQAFHWFEHAKFAVEAHRLLSPRGRVLVMWNMYQPTATPAAAAYWRVARGHAIDLSRIESKWSDGKNVARQFFTPESFVEVVLDNPIAYDFANLLARLASSSYMPQRGTAEFDAMEASLREAFDEHAIEGRFTLPNACELFLGRPR